MRIIPEKSDMLQHWMFSQIHEDRDDCIFIQDGAPPHFHHEVRQYLDDTSPGRWMGRKQSTDDPSRMLSTPSNLNVIQGATVLLPCNVLHLDRKVRVWKHLPSRILFSGTISVSRDAKIHLVNGSSLRIDDITPQYAGAYVCFISNHPFLTVTHRIQVLVPPSIEQDPPNGKAIVRKGNPATITCNVSGIPNPVVTWSHEYNGEQ
ncbi:hypothetical protein AVEN_160202-1, partial [Araneus ventricosus]